MKNLYVRDELYKKVISSMVKFNKKEIQKALDRSAESLQVKIIVSGDSIIIFKYYDELKNGASFDSLEKISDLLEYDSNKAPIKIIFGQMRDDYFEDTLYNKKIVNISSPVKTEGGWLIFKLIRINSQVPSNAGEVESKKAVMDVLRLRKSRMIGIKYLTNFYKDANAEINSTLFLNIVQKVSTALSEKESL